ncbi:Gfo/Idh/MocA family protein [Candidatus Epulonipiscium viviparus]|uniref:Gfo/Idh/MocA family protein n=1 Tax=Candidatus Epulonipiscium viviparus TaxID=420336 RepID=UPI00016C05D1|nr:Gfo/Idh/MocA family oxidoreductase [Candidatus Epulopiscium viviparus]
MFNEELLQGKSLRWGMVGGGRGSEVGYLHRGSALRDNAFTLVAGAFDIDPQRCISFGENLGIARDRLYSNYQEMFAEEAKRPDGIEVVSIATPNSTHFEIAKAALEANLHVICEKPLCFTVEQAQELIDLTEKKNRVFGVTYGYTGAQMLHQARKMVENGDLGEIRVINMQFAHGFHSSEVETSSAGAKWRVTPEIAGQTYVLADIGTHAFFLSEVIAPQLKVKELLCTRQSFIKSRAPLEDNAVVLLQYENGAIGNLWASAVNAGSMHQHKIRVIGSKASIEWWDEHPNQLKYEIQGEPARVLDRGMGYLYQDETINCDRAGGGHAEGLFDSWANLYHRFAVAIHAKNNNQEVKINYPSVYDGAEGVKFLAKCVESANSGSTWVNY